MHFDNLLIFLHLKKIYKNFLDLTKNMCYNYISKNNMLIFVKILKNNREGLIFKGNFAFL